MIDGNALILLPNGNRVKASELQAGDEVLDMQRRPQPILSILREQIAEYFVVQAVGRENGAVVRHTLALSGKAWIYTDTVGFQQMQHLQIDTHIAALMKHHYDDDTAYDWCRVAQITKRQGVDPRMMCGIAFASPVGLMANSLVVRCL